MGWENGGASSQQGFSGKARPFLLTSSLGPKAACLENTEDTGVWEEEQISAGDLGASGEEILFLSWWEKRGCPSNPWLQASHAQTHWFMDLMMAGISILASTLFWILSSFKQRSFVNYFNPKYEFNGKKERGHWSDENFKVYSRQWSAFQRQGDYEKLQPV